MDPLTEIRTRLDKYPDLAVIDEENMITVSAKSGDGFDVWFSVDDDEYTVGFEGWHQHFEKDEVEDALSCFAFGLSNECRLKVVSRGGTPYKWAMEAMEDGKWVTYSTTALLWAPFWRKKAVNYLSNNILSAANA